jgi:two-component system, OmpR family, sensor histidine kinase ArlS
MIAFRNLLDNACKFSDDDVDIEFFIEDNYIKVVISDNGIGIPSDELESIYLPFKRGSNASFIGGYGIGLYLVLKIMEIHDIAFKAYSTIDEGTNVELLLKRTE